MSESLRLYEAMLAEAEMRAFAAERGLETAHAYIDWLRTPWRVRVRRELFGDGVWWRNALCYSVLLSPVSLLVAALIW